MLSATMPVAEDGDGQALAEAEAEAEAEFTAFADEFAKLVRSSEPGSKEEAKREVYLPNKAPTETKLDKALAGFQVGDTACGPFGTGDIAYIVPIDAGNIDNRGCCEVLGILYDVCELSHAIDARQWPQPSFKKTQRESQK